MPVPAIRISRQSAGEGGKVVSSTVLISVGG